MRRDQTRNHKPYHDHYQNTIHMKRVLVGDDSPHARIVSDALTKRIPDSASATGTTTRAGAAEHSRT